MTRPRIFDPTPLALAIAATLGTIAFAQSPKSTPDAVADAANPRDVPATRPEQKKTAHDASPLFDPTKIPPSSSALDAQPEHGRIIGFDFVRDPLNAKRPM